MGTPCFMYVDRRRVEAVGDELDVVVRPACFVASMAPSIIASSAAQMPLIWSPYLASIVWVSWKPFCWSQLAGRSSSTLTFG